MTAQELFTRRWEAVLEFFSWRFGTHRWAKPLAYVTGLGLYGCRKRFSPLWFDRKGRRTNYVSKSMLIRWEEAALQLGYRPDKTLDVSVRPSSLPRTTDPAVRKRFYFERERTAVSCLKRALISEREGFRLLRSLRKQHKPKHNGLLAGGFCVDSQGLARLTLQDYISRVARPMRQPRQKGRGRARDPQQLELELEH